MGLRKTPAALAALGAAAALALVIALFLDFRRLSLLDSLVGLIAVYTVFALTFLGTDTAKYTLPIYVQYFYGRGSVDWGGIMAASTLFTIPVMAFFLIVQRRMVNGLVAGAVKG